MKLSDFLNNKRVECITDLTYDNWKRLLDSDERILKLIDEWKQFNLIVEIGSINHIDAAICSLKEKGYTHYFYNKKIRMYVTYEIQITRNLTVEERKQYGDAKGISRSFDLPLNMCIIVLRSDIQKRNKYKKEKCKRCCA